jgi:hypothetical protein
MAIAPAAMAECDMRWAVLVCLSCATAFADVTIPQPAAGSALRLPGWSAPLHLGMSIDEARRATNAKLEEGPHPQCANMRRCLWHQAGSEPELEPSDYWVVLQFDAKAGLVELDFGCPGTEACAGHPLADFWKAATGSATRDYRVARGMRWIRNSFYSDETGDASEDFMITRAGKRR